MGDPDSEERTFGTLWDNRAAGNNENHTSRRSSSVVEVGDVPYRDLAEPWPGLRIQSPSRMIRSTHHLTGHQERGSITNQETWGLFPEEDIPEGSVYPFDTEDEEQKQPGLPAQLQPPHQASLSMPFQQPPLRDPSLPPGYNLETFRLNPRDLWNFYLQKKQMIARHHWKLTSQYMSLSNAQRCVRMLMKHHWNLIGFISGLESDGRTEPWLLDLLLRDHAILMGTSEGVLSYFEGFLMALPQQ